jgi:RNA polymerase subunit RPABC4/transcription elongation factor Spt4
VNPDNSNTVLTVVLVYLALVAVALWLTMIVWTFRDMRARSRDFLAQVFVALLVAVLNIPGLLMYLFIRPRETLAEAYERSLEEEALLQEIEDKPACPGCRQRVREDWQACPNCHTRLKKPCVRCSRMLELAWDICPYCTTANPVYASDVPAAAADSTRSGGQVVAMNSYDRSRDERRERRRARAAEAQPLEFVEGDEP